jgi:energy-coupling factor transporter ATP-binding protein EcfA2
MIDRVVFRFGVPDGPPLAFRPAHLTVFVGPNNSGKSLALRNLEGALGNARNNGDRLVIESIVPARLEPAEVWRLLRAKQVPSGSDNYIAAGSRDGNRKISVRFQGDELDHAANPYFFHELLHVYTITLDGAARLRLVEEQPIGELRYPKNHWGGLFGDQTAYEHLNRRIVAAFGQHLLLDAATTVGKITPRLSPNPIPVHLAKALTPEAAEFFAQAAPLGAFSDGVKSYCGVISALFSTNDRIILIDEPDAFLHPPLARTLGTDLARLAAERCGHVFAATHDANFLMGAVSSGADVTIVRLTYREHVATARLLESSTLIELVRDPLLRATGVFDALFYQHVIVTEGHADRVLYDEVNHRLLRDGRGISDALFLNAGGWQNTRKLIRPLRKLGIPTAAIVDLDTIGKPDFSRLMEAADAAEATRHAIGQLSGDLLRSITARGGRAKDPVASFAADERRVVDDLVNLCRRYGVYVVPVGELEHWLPNLGIAALKQEWLPLVLDRIGRDPQQGSYVSAGRDDIWAFVDGIGREL